MKQRRTVQVLSIVLSSFALQGCLIDQNSQRLTQEFIEPLPHFLGKPDTFGNCAELSSWYQSRRMAWKQISDAYSPSVIPPFGGTIPVSSPAAPTTVPGGVTNVQVAGIDEPDYVKMHGDHIYYARAQSVEVFSSTDLAPIATLSVNDLSSLQLLQFGNRLAVIGSKSEAVEVRLFKDSDGRLSEEGSFQFRGSLIAARLIKNDLTLVVRSTLDGQTNDIPCERVAKSVINNGYEFSMTAIHTLNLAADKVVSESMASLGGADQVYMSDQNLYLFSSGYNWFWWDERRLTDPLTNSSIVRKLRLRPSQAPELVGAVAIQGQTRNNLAFHEDASGRYLFVATTVWQQAVNRIWVLGDGPETPDDTPIAVVGRSVDFGAHEDIRAVRFIGNRAYVVTFEQTDPLFVFDLSSPESPRLLSQLEIPGFSAYLHSLSPGVFFGAGYAATPDAEFSWLAGLQLSLFDVADDGRVSVTAQKQFGGRGSHVDAAHDYHAFTLDARTGLIALPVRVMAKEPNADPRNYSTRLDFSGAFVIDPKIGLEPVARLTHFEWIPERCHELLSSPMWWSASADSVDIRRVITVDKGLISLSPFGAKLHEAQTPFATKASLAFNAGEDECTRLSYPLLPD